MVRADIAERAEKIAGGFVMIPVATLMGAWRAVGIGDFRAYLAAHELVARRCQLSRGQVPSYSTSELAGLLGVTPKRAAGAVRRLVAAGVLEWSASSIEFPAPPAPAVGGPTPEDCLSGGRGAIMIPRRLLRHLARGASRAIIAVALSALLRCLSRRRSGWDGRGRLAASWVARHFSVSLRQVKSARAALVSLGWLMSEPDEVWKWTRWGRCYRIALDWAAPGISRPAILLPAPPPAVSVPPSARPDQTWTPSGRQKNQEPAAAARTGISGQGGQSGNPAVAMSPLGPPSLADVRPEDFRDTGRLLALHRQAVDRGVIGASESDRLRFVGLAEHCRAMPGVRSPGALFASLLGRRAWSFVTAGEEDRARRRLAEHERRGAGRGVSPVVPAAPSRPSGFVRDVADCGPVSLAAVMTRLAGGLPAGLPGRAGG